jgi:hypothetical protein
VKVADISLIFFRRSQRSQLRIVLHAKQKIACNAKLEAGPPSFDFREKGFMRPTISDRKNPQMRRTPPKPLLKREDVGAVSPMAVATNYF